MKEPFISVLISEEKLNERIAQLGEQISKDYEGKEVKLICILKGSIIFTCELAKRITVPVKFDFMQVSSYGSGTSSSGQIKIKKDLDESIEGEHVIVIEDIIDSGNTLARLYVLCLISRKEERLRWMLSIMALTFLMNSLSVMDLIMTRAIETFLL